VVGSLVPHRSPRARHKQAALRAHFIGFGQTPPQPKPTQKKSLTVRQSRIILSPVSYQLKKVYRARCSECARPMVSIAIYPRLSPTVWNRTQKTCSKPCARHRKTRLQRQRRRTP